MKGRRILNKTLISVSGKTIPLITSMMRCQPRNLYMKIQPKRLSSQFLKVTILPFLPTVKQEQERLTLWKDLNTQLETLTEE